MKTQNNRKASKARKKQTVMSEPLKIFDRQYLTKKGERLKAEGASKKELKEYTKNRYVLNPNARPVKVLTHTR